MVQFRELRLAHGLNFRDLGGYMTLGGQTVCWHRLVRSGYLSSLTKAEQDKLARYGIETVIDLRTSSEIAHYPDRYPPSFNYIQLPVLETDITGGDTSNQSLKRLLSRSPHAGFDMMMRAYRVLVLSTDAQRSYRLFLELLAQVNVDDGGVLFHCSTGKDRTGWATALLLGALGVPARTILNDYLLTNTVLAKWRQQRLKDAAVSRLGPAYNRSLLDLSLARPEYFEQAWSLVNYQFGGLRNYLRDELKLDLSVVQQLRKLYLQSNGEELTE